MAVAKLNKAGTTLQFIDEFGNVFYTSVNFFMGLLNGKSKSGFIMLKRLPHPQPSGKWAMSPVWTGTTEVDGRTVPLQNGTDSDRVVDHMSNHVIAEQKKKSVFKQDDKIW